MASAPNTSWVNLGAVPLPCVQIYLDGQPLLAIGFDDPGDERRMADDRIDYLALAGSGSPEFIDVADPFGRSIRRGNCR